MSKNNIIKIIIGSGIALLTSVILLFIVAILLAYTNISEGVIVPSIIIISAVSILVGSFISSIKIRKQGIINGGAVGAIYIIFLYLLSSMIQGDFGINKYSVILIICSVLAGCFGGILGVNKKGIS